MNLGQLIGELLRCGQWPAHQERRARPEGETTPARARKVSRELSEDAPKKRKRARRVASDLPVLVARFLFKGGVAGLGPIAAHLGKPVTHVSGLLTKMWRDGMLARSEARPYQYRLTLAGRVFVSGNSD